MITNDAFMLLSIVNMKLRDFYPSLDALCDDMNEERAEIEDVLKKIGYKYNAGLNRFEQQ